MKDKDIMSYSAVLKSELKYLDKSIGRHCLISELYGIIKTNAFVSDKNRHHSQSICLYTDNIFLAYRVFDVLDTAFAFKADVTIRTSSKSKKHHYILSAFGDNALRVLNAAESSMVLKQACCKQAYLRSVFLACASVSDPSKNYHLEYVFHSSEPALELISILEYFDIHSRLIMRKKNHVVYIKDGEKISQIFGLIGARKHLLDFESLRVLRTVGNEVNRKVNCETANIAKTAKAFVAFQEDIEYIEKTKGISYLSEPLRAVAELKLEYSSATLKEISEMLSPPISKSGVNHRLRKISEIAEKLRSDLYD